SESRTLLPWGSTDNHLLRGCHFGVAPTGRQARQGVLLWLHITSLLPLPTLPDCTCTLGCGLPRCVPVDWLRQWSPRQALQRFRDLPSLGTEREHLVPEQPPHGLCGVLACRGSLHLLDEGADLLHELLHQLVDELREAGLARHLFEQRHRPRPDLRVQGERDRWPLALLSHARE